MNKPSRRLTWKPFIVALIVVAALAIAVRRHSTGMPLFSLSNPSRELYLAIRRHDLKRAGDLLNRNPNLISTRIQGDPGTIDLTPLQVVVMKTGDTRMAVLLIQHGADIRAVDPAGTSLLGYACYSSEMAEWLIAHGADVNSPQKRGWAPLHTAVLGGRKDLVELLIDHGAAVDAKTGNGWTPLYIAAMDHDKGLVDLLLKHGADINGRNTTDTPLSRVETQSPDMAEFLRKRGAKPYERSSSLSR